MAVIDYEAVTSPYLERQKFGATGEYQLMTGVVHFAVDPTSPPNLRIVDLELAKRDRHGQVAFDADFRMLCPTDRTRTTSSAL